MNTKGHGHTLNQTWHLKGVNFLAVKLDCGGIR